MTADSLQNFFGIETGTFGNPKSTLQNVEIALLFLSEKLVRIFQLLQLFEVSFYKNPDILLESS